MWDTTAGNCTPELGAIASAESLAFVLTEAIATNTDISKEIRDKYGDIDGGHLGGEVG